MSTVGPPGAPSVIDFPMYFFILSTISKSLTKYSSVKLSDYFEDVLGTTESSVTIRRNGSLLVKAATGLKSFILSSLQFLDVLVVSTPDYIKNTSKGTIFAYTC